MNINVAKTILQNLGLTERQSSIYLVCLENGPLTISELVKKTNEKQTTLFDNTRILIDKGALVALHKGKRRLLSAEQPAILETVYEQKLSDLKQIILFLNGLNTHQTNKPSIRYYEGRSGVRQIYEEVLTCKEKQTYYLGSMKITLDILGNRYHQGWVNRRIKRGINTKTLRVEADEIKSGYYKYCSEQAGYLREVRYLPKNILVGCNLAIYDNKVMFVSGLREGFGFVVESEEFSQMMKNIFMVFWEMSGPRVN